MNDTGELHRINLSWLIKLRWGAAAGQLATILFVRFGMKIALPLLPLLGLVALAALSNLGCLAWLRGARQVRERALVAVLALDVLLLTGLLFYAGGSFNPFSFLYLVHIALAAVVLRSGWTWVLVVLSLLASGALFFGHVWLDLDDAAMDHMHHMGTHLAGMWVAFAVAAAFIVYFVTRIRRALALREADLEAERRHAARNDKLVALATLAAGAAHELATPLGTIVVAAKELERQLAGGRALSIDELKVIREQADRCRAILDQMSVDAGEGKGEAPSRITVEDLVGRVLPGLHAEPAVQVAVDASARGRALHVPATALAQALRGVLKNAQEASPRTAPVSLSARGRDGRLEIAVEDRGHGMAPEVLVRAGEPFFTTKPPGQGMGLGLFLTRSVVERLGGALELGARPEGGTRVTLRLPWDLRAGRMMSIRDNLPQAPPSGVD
jgi:two-component system sensor histidine kinase RegB